MCFASIGNPQNAIYDSLSLVAFLLARFHA